MICGDVGGSFGIKVHVYPDEVATAAIAKIMGRPVKFIADRLESFTTDIHARDHEITAKIAVDAEGKILAIDVDDWTDRALFCLSAHFGNRGQSGGQPVRWTL